MEGSDASWEDEWTRLRAALEERIVERAPESEWARLRAALEEPDPELAASIRRERHRMLERSRAGDLDPWDEGPFEDEVEPLDLRDLADVAFRVLYEIVFG